MNMMMLRSFSARLTALALLAVLALPVPARADDGAPSIIRDTEIEAAIKEWTKPVILAAGLDPEAVHIVLVQSDEINSFVAGGQNVFIYTGLIEKTKNPGELIGVIAHELGHIRGGHLVRMQDAMRNASYESILGTVLGFGAAILAHSGDAAVAGSVASGSQAERGFLAFSRVQESSADQSALYELKQAHMNPTGLLTFMQQLDSQELLPETQQAEYVRTHPLTRDRVDAIAAAVAGSPYRNDPWPAPWMEQHRRMVAKLIAFISPGNVPFTYDVRDQSVAARYARAIADYRQNHVADSLKKIDALIGDEPGNPYFHELKGQMLMEYGRLGEAVPELKKAVSLKADAPLIRILYAHALIASSHNGKAAAALQEAIRQLNAVQQDESRTPEVQHLLAMAYGYEGREPEAQLHLAEEALLLGNDREAGRLAAYAAGRLKKGSPAWLRTQDILSYIGTTDKKNGQQDHRDNQRTDQ